jgi:L-2-hydroxyglutarate oxidase LhgO
MQTVDAVVIGAGVVGLAAARALALRGLDTLILEAHAGIGAETSSRNSEVVHAGLYYPAGSLKARLCVEGREMLYRFCERHGIEHRQCGKLIVAVSESQTAELLRLQDAARSNDVPVTLLDRNQASSLEPAIACMGALHSPTTGIVDARSLMLALLGEAQSHGASLASNSRVSSLVPAGDRILIGVNGEAPVVQTRRLVNCAGLHATRVAHLLRGFPAAWIPTPYFAKGTYFSLAVRSPFRRLVYPVPEPGGLGVHLTLDLAGRSRFGPDVEWVSSPSYDVDPSRAERFYPAIRRYWPAIPPGSLQPAYAGVRPKIAGPGDPPADFRIDGPAQHGVAGVVNLFGIESPGLTACLAIARQVARQLA